MKRVLILGCPGAGKTTFARTLAAKTGLPLSHLDFFYHDSRFAFAVDKPAWRDRVSQLVAPDRWIIEGHYRSTLDLRLSRADTVLYLDYPRRIALWRMLTRNARCRHRSRPGMPPDWRDTIGLHFFLWVWNFNRKNRPLVYQQLAPYTGKGSVVIFRHPRDAQAYLDTIESPDDTLAAPEVP